MRGTDRCRMHGGKNKLAAPGSPERGGAPVKTGLFAKYLSPEMQTDYAEADEANIEHLLRVAKTYLARAIRIEQSAPHQAGSVQSTSPEGVTKKLQVDSSLDTILQFIEKIRRLEHTLSEIRKTAPPRDDDLEAYEQWLASARSDPSSSSGSS